MAGNEHSLGSRLQQTYVHIISWSLVPLWNFPLFSLCVFPSAVLVKETKIILSFQQGAYTYSLQRVDKFRLQPPSLTLPSPAQQKIRMISKPITTVDAKITKSNISTPRPTKWQHALHLYGLRMRNRIHSTCPCCTLLCNRSQDSWGRRRRSVRDGELEWRSAPRNKTMVYSRAIFLSCGNLSSP